MNKCNLGCGQFRKVGFVNVDVDPSATPDVLHNLNEVPYPFQNDTFDLIECDHNLEHLEDPFQAMTEIHRILKTGGTLILRVPHFSRGLTHADHKRGFDITFAYYFDRNFKGGFCGVEFELSRMRLRWYAQPYLKKLVLGPLTRFLGWTMGSIIDFAANLSPILCSRFWCYWVGGFEEIEFHFRKP